MKSKITASRTVAKTKGASKKSLLKLYVAGSGPKSKSAIANLKKLCEDYMPGQYEIEVIDLIERPQLAKGDQILAVPTLVRRFPAPIRKIIGDLSNTERLLVGLDIKPVPT